MHSWGIGLGMARDAPFIFLGNVLGGLLDDVRRQGLYWGPLGYGHLSQPAPCDESANTRQENEAKSTP